jgi:uncharacterized protein YraI/heat shock protein HslJ
MKIKFFILLLSLILVAGMLAACGGGETPTPEELTEAPESEIPTEPPPAGPQQVPVTDIRNINWQWVELVETNPAAQSVVPDPENYTLALFEDGTYAVTADCKSGIGNYTVDGSQITLEPFPVTMQICSETSLEPQYLSFLGQVDSFGLADGKLVFVLKGGAGEMRFQNSGMAEKPAPAPEQVTLFVGPQRVPCEGEGPQECYQVKETPDDEWQLFYDEIEGFEWEFGYEYELLVNTYQVENPPAGGSSLRYELVEVVSKTPVEVENVTGIDPDSVTINTFDLPYSYQSNLVQATPYNNTQPPGPTGLPQHIQINFGVTSPSEVKPGDPIFYIIPKAAYLEMWQSVGDPGVPNTLSLLEISLNDQPAPIPTEGMPVLPNEQVTGYNDLSVQGRYFNFDLGYGVRFVGRFNQDPNPVTNDGLFYIFQGFSYDGNYFYAFFYPVSTGVLPNTAADISDDEMARLNDDSTAYMAERAQALNTLAPADWDASLETLDSLVSSLAYVSVFDKPVEPTPEPPARPSLTNVKWEWVRFTDPVESFDILDPTQYWLMFATDNTFSFQADCNTGNGTYSADTGSISMEVTSITQALCDEDSLSDKFVQNLGFVGTYTFNGSQLLLDLMADSGQMFFRHAGGGVTPPKPGEGAPTATTFEPVNVRTGPGTQYPTHGTAPVGSVFEITGVSQDGEWWVVKVSVDISSTGNGWIAARYTETTGDTSTLPVVETPPLDGIEPPEPSPGTPLATALEPVNIRSGPSKEYESYGVASVGDTAEIIGVSADGSYWVIKISTDLASDGRGWVLAAYVKAENAENVPVIEAP